MADFFLRYTLKFSLIRFSESVFKVIDWDIYVEGWEIVFGYSAFRIQIILKLALNELRNIFSSSM